VNLGDRPVIAGLAGGLTIAWSAIFVRLADVAPPTSAAFRCLYAIPVLAVLAWFERRRYGPRTAAERRLAFVAGVFFACNLVFWHYAIGDVGAGLATVLGNLQVVLVPAIAWLALGERPEARVLAVLPLVFSGVVLISGVFEAGPYGEDPARGVLFGALTGLAYAAFIVVLRQGNADLRRPAGPLLDVSVVGGIGCVLIGLAVGDIDLAPSWPEHGWLLALALSSQVLGWLLISVSLPRLPAAVTSVFLTVQPVGSVVLGMLLLGEAPTALQLAGVACILAGLVGMVRVRRKAPA
jgi:drug/metabolite transporter (DMT)-like permease